MIAPGSVQTIMESIETLSLEEQALLFNLLHDRLMERQRQSNAGKTAEKREELKTGNANCDIRAAQQSNFWGDEGKATYHVLIKNEPEGCVSATLLEWSECKAVGDSRQEAVLRLHDLVNARLAEAEIVPVKITSTQSDNPWVRLAGKYEYDPQFDEMLEYIAAYRRELDEETEAYYRQLDAEDKAK